MSWFAMCPSMLWVTGSAIVLAALSMRYYMHTVVVSSYSKLASEIQWLLWVGWVLIAAGVLAYALG